MNQDKLQRSNGQVLIESVVAISVGLVGILGFLHLLTSSIAIAKDVNTELTATYLAAEGLEVVRSIIDQSYVDGEPWNTNIGSGSYEVVYNSPSLMTNANRYLHFDEDTGLYSYDAAGMLTAYRRVLSITEDSSRAHIISTVTWMMRGGEEEHVAVEDFFFDWRPPRSPGT